MVKSHGGLYAGVVAGLDQVVVMLESLFVDLTCAKWKDS